MNATDEDLIDDADTVIKSTYAGEYDADLDRLYTAVKRRREHLALQAGWAMKPGDRVQFVSGRPRYIIGEQGTVTKVMHTYVMVKLDQPVGKFYGEIRTPMSMIKKIPAQIPAN